ncbi:uncharacterized protein CCOS01_14859 [Colletotrichum costaricense]|uniref:Rhodopsin domain-containing protein n=1 Tax=Colletotrichum costaricense TaxID=1209916 RepID=A0AAI9YI73_9PEZI|nr:uncharacterized protein CCOS01_14859 [Colletotrichum costaricense]KAK1511097.1 hypothetical protein CCOS01_14859 [Colletotrichum costaricense]
MAANVLVRNLNAIQETQQQASVSTVDHALDGQSRFGEIVAILAVGSVLSTAAVSLRVYTRVRMLRTFGLDDSVMVVAQMFLIGSAVAIGLESKWGLGFHSWVPPPEDYVPYMKVNPIAINSPPSLYSQQHQSFYTSIIVYNIATCLVKISILLQYRRIFAIDIMQKLTLWGLAFMISWTAMLSFLLPMMCLPVAAFWDPTIEGRCIDFLAIWYTMAGVNLVADFAIFSMPIPVINSLQLPRKQKRMLLVVFCLGFFTCIISALRIRTLRVAADTKDPYWDNVDAATWSFLEVAIGILAACLPTLRPIFVTLLPRLFNASSLQFRSSGRPSKYGNPYAQPSEGNNRASFMHGLGFHRPMSSTEGLNRQDGVEMSGRESETSAEYTVSVSTGAPESLDKMSRVKSKRDSVMDGQHIRGHIRTTTVVTQEVTFEKPSSSKSNPDQD